MYGEGGWFLIEECSYSVLLHKCLEKSDEQDKNLAEDGIEERAEEQNLEMADAEEQEQEDNEMVEAGQDQNQEMVEAGQDQNVEMVEAGQEPTPQLEEKQKVYFFFFLLSLSLSLCACYLTCIMIFCLYYRNKSSRLRMEEAMSVATQHLWWEVLPRQVQRLVRPKLYQPPA